MNDQEKYFLLEKYDPNGHHATIKLEEPEDMGYHLCFIDPIKTDELAEFEFVKPYPRKPVMADYHFWRFIVVSNRIKEILQNMNIPGIDFHSAKITDNKGNTSDGYFILHIRHRIACLNKEKSVWKPPVFDPEDVLAVKKMVLNMDRLEQISLSERLIFGLGECFTYTLFHESVVDAITAINPTGLIFTPVADWRNG